MDLLHSISQQFNQQKQPDLIRSAQVWDSRADEVNQFSVAQNDMALNFLTQRISFEHKKILEISFGGGRYLLEFLRRGAQVCGVEISKNMLTHTQNKLLQQGFSLNQEALIHSAWEEVVLADLGWQARFDLVFIYMSPALSNVTMLEKALAATHSHFYFVSYLARQDSLLLELQDALGLPCVGLNSQHGNHFYTLLHLLSLWGYFPESHVEPRQKTSTFEVDYIFERYCSWLWKMPATDEQRQALRQILISKSQYGKIQTTSCDYVGHLYLNKNYHK